MIRPKACEACPYRRDVPSGVWSEEDYEKLPPYDADTGSQPTAVFACHATPKLLCHGWAVVGGERLLALRLRCVFSGESLEIPEPSTPLFPSGTAAAKHGLRDLKRPKSKARAAMQRLLKKHARLRDY